MTDETIDPYYEAEAANAAAYGEHLEKENSTPIILTEEVARKIWDAAIEHAADRVSKVYGSTVQPTDFDTFYKQLTSTLPG